MSRSSTFHTPVHQRIIEHSASPLVHGSIRGPVSFLNPTRAVFGGRPAADDANKEGVVPAADDVRVEWRARDNRKGRHILIVPRNHTKDDLPRVTSSAAAIAKGIWRMLTVYAWWDVSWWIAVLFTFGSAIFVISGFFYWLPLAAPSTDFHDESSIGGGVTAFIGATLFTVGGVLLIIEAANENQTACFGWAVEQTFTHHDKASVAENQPGQVLRAEPGPCEHHHASGVHPTSQPHLQHPDAGRNWEWFPTWHEMKTHYAREIGFWASMTEALGAIIFYISGIMTLPGIINNISTPVLWGTYWLAYLVGGILFVLASLLYMLETQPSWWKPAPRLIGWWIGAWNLVGSVGWTMSAAFGYCTAHWCEYQSDLSLLWASIAFLVGSVLLWYEALDKHPVVRAKSA
ncbi:hypothetical protein DOTSEDRAFT_83702 [Dothistroma septosporum NZE10]|uniref:Integral membrane protein n=1 Tax=Dothistroma septosporum (strain NZE10 / CBS 128990) TaxID=675120 RepID=N1PBY1_DOTSN|nr:hypothetical protein DOTSEDRAFT_83702 [Dothistroma septosporum NZE10]